MENTFSITPKGVKREAKGLLTGNWSRALATLCITLMALIVFIQVNQLVSSLLMEVQQINAGENVVFNSLIDYYRYSMTHSDAFGIWVTLGLAVFYYLIVSPLNLGVKSWYRQLAQCGNLQVGRVFYYYRSNERFLQALKFESIRLAISLGAGLVSFAPAIVCLGVSAARSGESISTPLNIAAIAFAVVGLLVYAMITLRFFLASYLFVGDHGLDISDCLRYSMQHMKGRTGKVLTVILSFAGHILSCLLVAPAAYAIPYINAGMAACAQDIIDETMSETIATIEKTMVVRRANRQS